MIELKNLRKTYNRGSIAAVDNVTLSVEAKSFVSVTGPSGSGKSTLLLCAAGLVRPDSGEVLINDCRINNLQPSRAAAFRNKHVGFVFQMFHLIPYLTAAENVMLPLFLTKRSSAEQKEKAAELLGRVSMGHRTDHRPAELSAGEQQRVSIARAIAADPDVVFADEPTGNLDRNTGKEIIQLLKEIAAEEKTVFMVTHDTDAADAADRKYSLIDGQVHEK